MNATLQMKAVEWNPFSLNVKKNIWPPPPLTPSQNTPSHNIGIVVIFYKGLGYLKHTYVF